MEGAAGLSRFSPPPPPPPHTTTLKKRKRRGLSCAILAAACLCTVLVGLTRNVLLLESYNGYETTATSMATRTTEHVQANSSNLETQQEERRRRLPLWIQEYVSWHEAQRAHWSSSSSSSRDNEEQRFLVMTCLAEAAHCGGTSDRLRNVAVTLRLAAETNRILLIYWEKPARLEAFLMPPNASASAKTSETRSLDWRTPDWLVPNIRASQNHATNLPALEKQTASPVSLVTTTLQISAVHAEWFYNDRARRDKNEAKTQTMTTTATDDDDDADEEAYQREYHALWYTLFTPVPRIAAQIESELDRMQLVPGAYTMVHLRAHYAMESEGRDPALVQAWTLHALQCASHLRPGGPFFFAADSIWARQVARDYGIQQHVSVQTTSVEEGQAETLHLDKVVDWQERPASDFDSVFVDLYLLSLGECLSYNMGGFGLWAHAISGGNASCVIRHWTEGVAEDQGAHKNCSWVATAATADSTTAADPQTQRRPLFLPPMKEEMVDGSDKTLVETELQQVTKPNLVLHLGPPKTATSTLQLELSKQTEVLASDGYVYLGAWMDDQGNRREPLVQFRQTACHLEMHKARQEYKSRLVDHGLREHLLKVSCAATIKAELEKYRAQGQSLILSDETLSFRWRDFDSIPLGAPLDWISLSALLAEDWNIVIVVGYRRYADWLTSVHEQRERWTAAKRAKNKWTLQGGDAVQPIFPNYVKGGPESHAAGQHFMFTHELLTSVNHVFETRVLDMHQEASILTTFACDCLSGAAKTCAWSRERDKVGDELRANQNEHTLFYDALAVAAVEDGLLDPTNYNRHSVALAIEDFHVQSGVDFALLCPTVQELQDFLSVSLTLEERIAGFNVSFIAAPADHRAQFIELGDRQAFCWIDTKAVLKDPSWSTFFTNLPTAS